MFNFFCLFLCFFYLFSCQFGHYAQVDERELKEIKSRITTLESTTATILQYLAHMSGSIAEQHVRYDSLLERIERRLDLTF